MISHNNIIMRAEKVLVAPIRLDSPQPTLFGAKQVMATAYPTVTGVTFKDAPGIPDCCVGDNGTAYSFYAGQWCPVALHAEPSGHLRLCLKRKGKSINRFIHRLVLEAFVGPCPKGMEARHFPDRNPENNHLSNLSWATRKRNAADRKIHDTDTIGERQWNAKLTEPLVRQIRELAASGIGASQISRTIGVWPSTISKIVGRKSWRHIP